MASSSSRFHRCVSGVMNADIPSRQKVLLVSWDLASWRLLNPLLDQGKLPHLNALIEQGIMGDLQTQRPLLDEVVFNSIATGTYADKHGVLGPLEIGPQNKIRPTGSYSRQVDAVWDILSDCQRKCHVINYPLAVPAEKIAGTFVAPIFFEKVPTRRQEKFEIPLVSVHPESELAELTQFIVTLEDIDADVMSLFVPQFQELDAADPELVRIGALVAQTFSVHATATHLMENQPWDFVTISYGLIESLSRAFFQYHVAPTGSSQAVEQENRYRMRVHLFSEVINAAAMLCDRLLGRLLELAGTDATVILYSPWGILGHDAMGAIDPSAKSKYSDRTHRGEGIFLLRQADVQGDELLHGISFLDICPTVLRSCGVDLPAQLVGNAVQDYAGNIATGRNLSSWTEVGGEDSDRPMIELDRAQTSSLVDKFSEKPLRHIEKENAWTMAIVKISSGRREEAIPLLLRLYFANPLEASRGYIVTETLYRSGLSVDAIALMRPLAKVYADHPIGQFMIGFISLQDGELDKAREMFELSEKSNPPFPVLYQYLGQVYLLLRLPEQAIKAFEKYIELDPCLAKAYLGLSESYLRCGRFEEAAGAALDAVGTNFNEPSAHVTLGRAMAQLKEYDRSREAYETALRLDPNSKLVLDHLELLDQHTSKPTTDQKKQSWQSLTPPMYLQISDPLTRPDIIKDCMEQITAKQNDYLDDLEAADLQLNQLLENHQTEGSEQQSLSEIFIQHTLKDASDSHWVIRPADPMDQADIMEMFTEYPFNNISEKEIFVAHPMGNRKPVGAVLLQSTMTQPRHLRIRFFVGAGDDSDSTQISLRAKIHLWLLRTALIRAIWGGAVQVSFTFHQSNPWKLPSDQLDHTLALIGFKTTKIQEVYEIDTQNTRDTGKDMMERLKKRGKVPEDTRLTSLAEIPHEKARGFMRQWFADGLGETQGEVHLSECPVLLHGDKIIGCVIGYMKDEVTCRVTRIAVHPEYRNGWATPWLIAGASVIWGTFGRQKIEFAIDESHLAGWVKIARRHLKAEQTDELRTMMIDLSDVHP